MVNKFQISNEGKIDIPKIDFALIKDEALGKDYSLSLVFTDSKKIQKLNLIYRDKDYPTDILSFPLSDDEGEIYISLQDAQKEAIKFNRPYENFIAFLFIHGCVHLKGHDHGSTMENIEVKLRDKFNI